ncbi:MAG: hypothetical protein JOY78_04180 [Pseudonocardia sp.]|nr:hypothetical protein [Pseudonocardia sp.]
MIWTCGASVCADGGTSTWFEVRPRLGGGSPVAFRHVGLTPAVSPGL